MQAKAKRDQREIKKVIWILTGKGKERSIETRGRSRRISELSQAKAKIDQREMKEDIRIPASKGKERSRYHFASIGKFDL